MTETFIISEIKIIIDKGGILVIGAITVDSYLFWKCVADPKNYIANRALGAKM